MAVSLNTERDVAEDAPDEQEAFIERVAAKYEKQDDAPTGADEESEDESEEEPDDDDATDTDEDPEAGTSAEDPDGGSAESDADSKETKTDDHTGDEPESTEEAAGESDDDEPEEAEEKGDDDEDEPEPELSEEFTAAAKALNVPLTLDDVPEGPGRIVVAQKLRVMDAGFTRAMQELRAYRTEQTQFRAEQAFRAENPDLVVLEMLQNDPTLIDRVNERMEKAGDETVANAFKITIEKKRADARQAIENKLAADAKLEERIVSVVTFAQRLSSKAGLPWEFAESAVERAILRKPATERDLSDEDIAEIIKAEATNYHRHVRAHRREESKRVIQDRTASKKTVTPGKKVTSAAASPKPGPGSKKKINYADEESRQAPMMEFARRKFPGAKDE